MTTPTHAPAATDARTTYLTAPRDRGGWHWWRAVVAILLAILVLSAVPLLVATVATNAGFADHRDSPDYAWQITVRNFGALVACLPLLLLINRALNRLPTRAQLTGAPAWRWSLALKTLAVSVVAVTAYAVVWFVIEDRLHLDLEPRLGVIVLALVLLAPLQVLAEELLFRGMFLQGMVSALGAAASRVAISLLVTSLLFALMHGAQSPELWAARFGMALIYGYATWRANGLEVPWALHTANNVVLLLFAAATGSYVEMVQANSTTWTSTLLQFVALGAACLVAVRLTTRRDVATA